ncbi:tigger transposable element-derived protein 6-like, partial [Aphis craccivora]
MGPVKYKCLSIADKKKVIAAVEAASTLSKILKQKDHLTILILYSSRIRQKKCEYPDLEECLMAWFTQCRQNNIPISGPILKEKSELFATNLGITNFQVSEGWLEKFKKRHDLTFKKVCGESASVDTCISQDSKNELINLLVDYDARDIFNADEIGLFYKCLPDRTLAFKNEKCHGGKNSKERITVMLAANMDGSQKLKPLMIGKYANPRCFKNLKSFPLMYRSNKKAWMTGVLFTEWLICIDADMKKANRKILMFIDN